MGSVRARTAVHRGRDDDRGVTLILVGLVLTALLVVVAIVLDLGLVRQNRQADKSATDFAAAAGVRGLENVAGVPQPWKGVCTARAYLVENDHELDGMTGTYANGTGSVTYGSDPCASPMSPPYTNLCTADPATWAVYTGVTDGGRVQVTIRSGYRLPDPAFPEDTAAGYAADGGNAAHNGCDQLAVIIDEREPTHFGRIVGVDEHRSRIRSVGRIDVGIQGEATPALLLLERNDCEVLFIGGDSGAKVVIETVGEHPGIIHADSLGNGAGCDPDDPENGNIFQVNSNPADPRIVVGRAIAPVGAEAPGVISSVALSGAAGAVPQVVSSPWPEEVCAAALATDCTATVPVTGVGPREGNVVGRAPIDRRYRAPIIGLRDRAAVRFAWEEATDLPPGWTPVACGAPGPFVAPRVWVDCDGQEFDGSGKLFASSVDEIVIDGSVAVRGNGNTLHLVSPDAVYIEGSSSAANALELAGTSNRILVNDGGLLDGGGDGFVCDDRYAAAPLARTQMVIGDGPVLAAGGSGKVLRMCQTTLFMMDDSGAPACPVPSTDGAPPYDNGCRGRVRVAGANQLDWSAPNVNNLTTPTRAQLDELEDLAFWSETQGSGSDIFAIEGTGGLRLAGIFFTPNADPFRVAGGGVYDIEDAQFITRRLEVAGNGVLRMHPQPQNAVQVPVFGDFSLVR